MPVPAPGEMPDFRPGVGIEVVVAGQTDAILRQQAPEIDQIGADEQRVGRQFHGFAATDTVAGLVDAEYEVVGEGLGDAQGAPAHAAAGIENKRGGRIPGVAGDHG
ncbi:hypothetical protein SDC9_169148 [bioreactor metagenome]|uniref:Uncharacterized protein n=1 Tax=bioreactor metagenome TaxID=1076179 RepID=A0A645G4I5_9ZZZZ